MAISLDVLSQTILAIEPEVSYALQQSIPVLSRSKQLGKIEYIDGSYGLQIPVEVANSTVTTSLSTGFEALNMSTTDATAPALFTWYRSVRPVNISHKEIDDNSGDKQVIKLADTRYKNALMGLSRQVNQQIIRGDVPGFSLMGTLNGCTLVGQAGGFLEDAAPGSQGRTVGGLSKSTYASVPGWQNQYADAGGTFLTANAGLNAMRSIRTRASLNMQDTSDTNTFHLIVLHPDTFNLYEQSLFNFNRFMKEKDLDAGKFTLMFDDAPVYADPAFDLGGNLTTSHGVLSGYFLNLDQITLAIHERADFAFSEFKDIPGQDVITGKISFHGGLIAKSLGGSGVLTNAIT